MAKNEHGQEVRDEAQTDAWVREAPKDAHTEAEFIERAKGDGVPGFVARARFKALQESGDLEAVGQRLRLKPGK